MLQYDYVRIVNEALFSAKYTQHQDIINERAKRGDRYVGFIPVRMDGYGRIKEMDLVFELNSESPQYD